MNTKFILPGSLALTFHAFLLFGLTGKTLPATVEPEAKSSVPTDAIPVDQDDPRREPRNADDEESPVARDGPDVSRLPDIPVIHPPVDWFTVPTLPPIKAKNPASTIPVTWQLPGGPGKRLGPDPIDSTRLDRTPRARSQPAPIYPADLRNEGIEGTVLVEFLVDLEGNVHDPVVLRASHPGFIESAVRAVARWKFEPGYSGGRKVRFRMSVPVVFTIASL
ncbi:MAG TPA: TonB family protein [Opitutaceae bacterium]|jgi:protein TonB|nr:TonB family protein [Opitutaceae bacterium]